MLEKGFKVSIADNGDIFFVNPDDAGKIPDQQRNVFGIVEANEVTITSTDEFDKKCAEAAEKANKGGFVTVKFTGDKLDLTARYCPICHR